MSDTYGEPNKRFERDVSTAGFAGCCLVRWKALGGIGGSNL